jgi:uncharacterized protein YqeY
MTLIDKIKADQLQARKDRDPLKSVLLTTLIGEASLIGTNDGKREVTDAEVVAVVKKFIKGIDETLKYLGDHAPAQSKVVKSEKDMLEVYLPKQYDDYELKVLILGANLANTSKGQIMKYLKDNYAGQYDGKVAAKVFDELLK